MTEPGQVQQVIVVGADGQSVVPGGASGGGSEERLVDQVEQPAKVMRIGSMVKQLLEEVRSAPLDVAARERLRDVHDTSIKELGEGLAPELRAELERITLPFSDDDVPSDAELRVAQAQLVGWLEGLFHGIQTALVAQQMAQRLQLEQQARAGGRMALPGGAVPGMPPGLPGVPGAPQPGGPAGGTGQYL